MAPNVIKYYVGQRVILNDKELGTITAANLGGIDGLYVYSPTRGYAFPCEQHNIKPLPNGQL